MIRRLSKLALIALLFGLVAYIEAHAAPPTRRPDLPTHDGVWYIGGYLPESPDKKVWVRIKDDTITFTMVVLLALISALAIVASDGGYKYKLLLHLSVLLFMSGVSFWVVPPVVGRLLTV